MGARTARVDLAYRDYMIVIEYDSFEYHSPRSAFDNDLSTPTAHSSCRGTWCLRYTSTTPDSVIVAEVTRAITNSTARGCLSSASKWQLSGK